MRPSTSHRTECAGDYPHSTTPLICPYTRFFSFPSRYICSFIFIDFIITIRILHCLPVCACRMHRRKGKQGSSILTTTWSGNRNVWALAPKLTSHVYPHSQHRTHRHYRTHHDSCDMRVTRERQSGWLALWGYTYNINKILVIIIYLILFICMRI